MKSFEKSQLFVPWSVETSDSRRTLKACHLIAKKDQDWNQKVSGLWLVCSNSCAVLRENMLYHVEVIESCRRNLIFHFFAPHHLNRKHNNRHWTVSNMTGDAVTWNRKVQGLESSGKDRQTGECTYGQERYGYTSVRHGIAYWKTSP
jgi:hypothetical protein